MKRISIIKEGISLALDESGSTVMIALIILVALTILGISAIDTTSIELRISRNDRIYRQNVDLAEAGAKQAVRQIVNMNGDGTDPQSDYRDLNPSSSDLPWITSQANDFFADPANWDTDGDNSAGNEDNAASDFVGKYRYTADFLERKGGSSLNAGDLAINLYAVYGLSQQRGGASIVQMGCKKTIRIP